MQVGIIWSVEAPIRRKMQRKGELILCWSWDICLPLPSEFSAPSCQGLEFGLELHH